MVVDLPQPEKYEFINWDDDIPNISGKIKVMFQTTNQINVVIEFFDLKKSVPFSIFFQKNPWQNNTVSVFQGPRVSFC